MVSLVREWVLFILLFILSMGSRKAVLSAPRTLDMVPLGEILQGRSNQGDKAYSDNSDRYNSDSGILKGVLPPNWKKAWSSGEPTPAWSNDTFGQGVKYIQKSPVTSAFECSLSNHQSINVQGQLQSGLEFKELHLDGGAFVASCCIVCTECPSELQN